MNTQTYQTGYKRYQSTPQSFAEWVHFEGKSPGAAPEYRISAADAFPEVYGGVSSESAEHVTVQPALTRVEDSDSLMVLMRLLSWS